MALRKFFTVLLISLSLFTRPAAAMPGGAWAQYLLNLGCAAFSATLNSIPQVVTIQHMYNTGYTQGVAPASYMIDAISNLVLLLQLTAFESEPDYYAAAVPATIIAADLVTLRVFYGLDKPASAPFVRIDLRRNEVDDSLTTVVRGPEDVVRHSCPLDSVESLRLVTKDEIIEWKNCQVCVKAGKVSWWERSSDYFQSLFSKLRPASGDASELECIVHAANTAASHTFGEGSRIRRVLIENDLRPMSIIIYKDKVEVVLPHYSETIYTDSIHLIENARCYQSGV